MKWFSQLTDKEILDFWKSLDDKILDVIKVETFENFANVYLWELGWDLSDDPNGKDVGMKTKYELRDFSLAFCDVYSTEEEENKFNSSYNLFMARRFGLPYVTDLLAYYTNSKSSDWSFLLNDAKLNPMESDLSKYKLCYVKNNILYFTDDFKHAWGDDWDDAPYECNAGEPYEKNESTSMYSDHTTIRYIGYLPEFNFRMPCDSHFNSPYSVKDINNGAIPWLYCDKAGGLMGGSTMQEAIDWLNKTGVKWAELVKH